MNIVMRLLINGLAVFISSKIIPGVVVDSFFTAIVFAVVLGIINVIIKPILLILTLPFNIVTLGLFTFILNAFLILLASLFVPGFSVHGFITALLFSLVLSLVSSFLNSLAK
ncbi:MAG: phage holin family protein [bacterium]|nr:phage holin family protein [bacterium]